MAKTPIALVKEQFKDKAGLIKAVRDLAKGDLWAEHAGKAEGLDRQPNRKLLRLHDTLSAVKKEYGSRAKMVDAIAEAEGRGKDKDFRNRFETWSAARLYDAAKAAKKRAAKRS